MENKAKNEKGNGIEKAVQHVLSCPMQDRATAAASYADDENINVIEFANALKKALAKEQELQAAKMAKLEKTKAAKNELARLFGPALRNDIDLTKLSGAEKVTVALAKGADMKTLQAIRGGIESHLSTLRSQGFSIVCEAGVYRITEVPKDGKSAHCKLFI